MVEYHHGGTTGTFALFVSAYAEKLAGFLVPPLWFRVMDPQGVAHCCGDMAPSNFRPFIWQDVLAQSCGAVR